MNVINYAISFLKKKKKKKKKRTVVKRRTTSGYLTKNGESYVSTPSLLWLRRGLFFARWEVKGLKQRKPARGLKGSGTGNLIISTRPKANFSPTLLKSYGGNFIYNRGLPSK